MKDDLYECARRKCKHRYKDGEAVMVEEKPIPGKKTIVSYRGTCPKCGHDTFYIVKKHNSPNAAGERQPPAQPKG
jgi:predicted  nucleic acid-binding Zn-ribbon protein